LQKEEKKTSNPGPPPPILHSKQLDKQKCKKKKPEMETLISHDNKNDSYSAAVTTGTQNSRIKASQPLTGGNKQIPETGEVMVPNEDQPKPSRSETSQCTTDVKSNVPWYLQD
jgi:hypothetical protein